MLLRIILSICEVSAMEVFPGQELKQHFPHSGVSRLDLHLNSSTIRLLIVPYRKHILGRSAPHLQPT